MSGLAGNRRFAVENALRPHSLGPAWTVGQTCFGVAQPQFWLEVELWKCQQQMMSPGTVAFVTSCDGRCCLSAVTCRASNASTHANLMEGWDVVSELIACLGQRCGSIPCSDEDLPAARRITGFNWGTPTSGHIPEVVCGNKFACLISSTLELKCSLSKITSWHCSNYQTSRKCCMLLRRTRNCSSVSGLIWRRGNRNTTMMGGRQCATRVLHVDCTYISGLPVKACLSLLSACTNF